VQTQNKNALVVLCSYVFLCTYVYSQLSSWIHVYTRILFYSVTARTEQLLESSFTNTHSTTAASFTEINTKLQNARQILNDKKVIMQVNFVRQQTHSSWPKINYMI